MKILTLTFHNSFSHGALLQCYALVKYFELKGHEAKVLDYRSPAICEETKWVSFKILKKASFKGRIYSVYMAARNYTYWKSKKKVFDSFVKEYIPLTTKTYYSIEELENDFPECDIIFSGSDQVWNPNITNGYDKTYFMNFNTGGAKKCSYAASVGMELNNDQINEIISLSSNMDFITVREEKIKALLEDRQVSASLVCDPVFLLSKEEWCKIIPPSNYSNYILVYNLSFDEELYTKAREYADNNNLEIIDIGLDKNRSNSFGCKRLFDVDPLALVSLINNASMVFTSSFHGIAMSLICEKEFLCFLPHLRKDRLLNLMKIVGIEDKIYTQNLDVKNITKIDYLKVNQQLERYKEDSILIVNQALNMVEKDD